MRVVAGWHEGVNIDLFDLMVDGLIIPHDSSASLAFLGVRTGFTVRVQARSLMCCNFTCLATKCSPRAKHATDAVLLVHMCLSLEMKPGRNLTQQRKPKGVAVPTSTPFSRNRGGNPGQGQGAISKALALEALQADMDRLLFSMLQAKIQVPPRKETPLLAKLKEIDKARNGSALESAKCEESYHAHV